MILLTGNIYVKSPHVASLNADRTTNHANSKSYSATQVTPTLVNPRITNTAVAENLPHIEIQTVVMLEQNIILP